MIMELMILASFVLAAFSYDETWSLFALGFAAASIIPWMIKEITEWYEEEWRNPYYEEERQNPYDD